MLGMFIVELVFRCGYHNHVTTIMSAFCVMFILLPTVCLGPWHDLHYRCPYYLVQVGTYVFIHTVTMNHRQGLYP